MNNTVATPAPQHISLADGSQQKGHSTEVESSRAIQEVKAALIIAKNFPRDELAATDKILKACLRPSLADSGLYQYARGGTDITGPSIRLAETIAQNWGNMDFGWLELDRRGNSSSIKAYAWDMETNTRKVLNFDVKQIRTAKGKTYPLTDERDIYENNANQAARRMRACILSLIPGDLIEAAVDRCEKTIAEQCTPEIIAKLIKAYESFNVNVAMIEKKIQRKAEAIGGKQVVELRRIYNSLKDGMSSASDWFEISLATKKDGAAESKDQLDKFKEKNAVKQPEQGQSASEDGKLAPDSPTNDQAGSNSDPSTFDIEDQVLTTEQGTRLAVTSLCNYLGTFQESDRSGVFVAASGPEIIDAMTKFGLDDLSKKFSDLGVALPGKDF